VGRTFFPKGYGSVFVLGFSPFGAHLIAVALHTGQRANSASACHTCDNPPCCNPSHLFWGAQSDNIKDASRKGRLRTLADQGADVVKVEAPGGDILRFLAAGSRSPAMSGKFINFNRNKRSVGLDIKQPEGAAALRALLADADVFVSNVRPAGLERAGLDFAALHALNPRLIHCSILAFGRGGRYFNRPAYDPIIQSLSGVAGTFHRATGEPRFVPMVMTDHVTGLIAAQSIGAGQDDAELVCGVLVGAFGELEPRGGLARGRAGLEVPQRLARPLQLHCISIGAQPQQLRVLALCHSKSP
jgi:hypothetical protein